MHGHLDKITTPAGDFEYARMASSDLVSQMTRPNGVTSTWSYEQNRNLITQVQNGSISTYGYVNDAIGRRTSMSRVGSAHPIPDTISYSYNDRSEVTGALSDVDASYSYAYIYDPIGNRVSASEAGVPWTYTTNNLNEYTSATEDNAQLNFSYDLDGSMTYRHVDAATGWTQVWNGENRMVETWKGNERLTFQYDYMGRRVEKKVYDGQTLATHLKFVYDGFKLVEELDGINADAPLRRYTWQPFEIGLDVVLQMTDIPNAAHSFHLHDANKNVMQIVDDTGIFVTKYAYSPFGNAIGELPIDFGFSSEYFDPRISLTYFNYRYYSNMFGKWILRDPIAEVFFENIVIHKDKFHHYENQMVIQLAYLFANNNSLNMYDINGLIGATPWNGKWSGNWCGGGWTGGKDIDAKDYDWENDPYSQTIGGLDECCRAHDACYAGWNLVSKNWYSPVDKPNKDTCDDDLCKCSRNLPIQGPNATLLQCYFCDEPTFGEMKNNCVCLFRITF